MNPFKKLFSRMREAKSAVDTAHFLSAGYDASSKEAYAPVPALRPDVAARIYEQTPVVYAMAKIKADLMASVPLRVYMRGRSLTSRPVEKLSGYPYTLLRWVNPTMTRTALMRNTFSWLSIAGEAYWAIEETPAEYASECPLSIYPLNPKFVRIVADPDTGARGYVYEVGAKKIYYPLDKVIAFHDFNPSNHWHAMSPLQPLEFTTLIEKFTKRGLKLQYQRGATIDAVITSQQGLNDEELRKLKREYREQYSGLRNAHRLLVLDNGMTYQPIDPRQADLGTIQLLQGPVMDDFAMVFGVPYAVAVGKGDKLTEVEFLMWNKTLIPLGMLVDEMLTKMMASFISDRMFISFDYSNVAALRLHDLNRARVEVAHVNTGLRTPNEIRAERLLAPYDGDNAEFGDSPFPKWKAGTQLELAEQQADLQREAQQASDPSLGLPGSEGGRDQSDTGDANMLDESGSR